MSKSQTHHAATVVDSFREKLSKSGIEHVGQKHFDELQLLVESAIDSAVFLELEKVADKLQSVTNDVRQSAERFD